MKIRYLNNIDYRLDIQEVQLLEIEDSQSILQRVEKLAIEEINYYLTQRFDLTKEFTNTGSYSNTYQYKAADRVIIDYTDWSSTKSYVLNNCVINNGYGYILNTASYGPTTSFGSEWTNIGSQNDFYYITYPAPLFQSINNYNQGDVVFWNGYTYSCNSMTNQLNLTDKAQYLYINNLPPKNVFPDDKIANINNKYWSVGSTFSVPVGTLPTDTNYWTNDDNRCLQLLNIMLDMVIYYLHRTIAPRNIPDLRKECYKKSCKILEDVGNGDYTISALVRQNSVGTAFRYGGSTSDQNSW